LWWPTGILRRLNRRERLQWLASMVLSLLFVSALKYSSHSSCPWDLAEFGGAANYLPHWAGLGRADGGPGRCFPAGHASAAFAFFGGYFVLRRDSPVRAGQCLVAVAGAGLALGLAQQLRGAHFMSHTLWTAWLCWAVALTVDAVPNASRPCARCP
jgi:membrane-associated PAP2 superfamily phosphatase